MMTCLWLSYSFIQFLWNKWAKNKTKIHQWYPPMCTQHNWNNIWASDIICWITWGMRDKFGSCIPDVEVAGSELWVRGRTFKQVSRICMIVIFIKVYEMLAFWFWSFSPSALMKCTVLLFGNYIWWVCHKMWFLWECCTSPWKKALRCQTWFDS